MADNPLGMFGYLPGKLSLLSNGAPAVPPGQPRPFARGEYLNNPNGSWSNEMTYTAQDPSLNAGKPTLIPGLWIKDGEPYHATEDEAAMFAAQSGLHWPAYSSLQQAEGVSTARENGWQAVPRERASVAAPLFLPPRGLFGSSR